MENDYDEVFIMADGLVVGTRFEQMKAVEGWALECFQESLKKSPNNEEIIETLKKINLQVRKLWKICERQSKEHQEERPRWRGVYLQPPGGAHPDVLKKLTEIRATAVVTLRDIKKDKALSNSSKRTLRMLSSLATEVVKEWYKWCSQRKVSEPKKEF